MLKMLKPFFFENSKLPKVLSYFAPIEISAISLFGFVFSKDKMSEVTKRHEVIHFQQQIETGMIGFLVIYLWDYAKNRLIHKMDGPTAYLSLRAEKEAYFWHEDETYLENRKRWAWLHTEWVKEVESEPDSEQKLMADLDISEDTDELEPEYTERLPIINTDGSTDV